MSGLLGGESQVKVVVRKEGGGVRRVVVCPLTTTVRGVMKRVREEEGGEGGKEVMVLVSWEKGVKGGEGLRGMVGKRGVVVRRMREEEVLWLFLRGKSILYLVSHDFWQRIYE